MTRESEAQRSASSSSLSRRHLLTATLAAAGAAAAGARPGAAPAIHRRRRPSDSVRVGLVGIGRRGHTHLQTIGYPGKDCTPCSKRPDTPGPPEGVEVVAVCDTYEVNLLRASRHLSDADQEHRTYVDYRKMLDEESLDSVIIATPDHMHAPIAMDAARAGCDAYIEKSMTNTIEETYELGRILEETGRIIQIGYQLHQDSMRETAREIVKRGILGDVIMVQDFVNRSTPDGAWIDKRATTDAPPPEQVHWKEFLGVAPQREYDPSRYFEWRKYWDYGTGICGDLLTHSLDSTSMVLDLGMPTAATASGGIYRWKDGREVPDQLSAAFEYPDSNLSVNFQCTLGNAYTGHRTLFLGTDASMELSWEIKVFPDAGSARYAYDFAEGKKKPGQPFIYIKKGKDEPVVRVSPSQLWLQGRGMTVTTRDGMVYDMTRLHHEEFIDCIRTRKQPSAGYASTLSSTLGAHMANQAFRTGRRVEWDAEAGRVK